MADLLGLGWLVKTVNWVYWTVAALCIWYAWRAPKQRSRKIITMSLVSALFLTMPILRLYQLSVFEYKYSKAKRLFDRDCQSSGEKIYQTVVSVDGVLLMKMRPVGKHSSDQYELNDPYGFDLWGDGYIYTIISGKSKNGNIVESSREGARYRFAYAKSPDPSIMYRYELAEGEFGENSIPIVRTSVTSKFPRYGVTFDDISTKEDRDNWIAGSSLRIIDLQTNAVVAERIGYMFDKELGNTNGERQPWFFATYNACPAFPKPDGSHPYRVGQTRAFLEKVLQPSQDFSQGK